MYEVIFLTAAIREIEHAATWYSEQQEDLGQKFKENIFAEIDKLQSDNLIHGPVYKHLSRVFAKRFPYSIFFRKDRMRKLIIISGVLHSKQNSSILDKRI